MHIYILTGGIASGKSTVSNILRDLGCPIIDADAIVRQVMKPGKAAWKRIVDIFSVNVLSSDGYIDEPELIQMILEDSKKRRLLHTCIYPFVQREILWQVLQCFLRGENLVVLVLPLLYESVDFLWMAKRTIFVNCSYHQHVQRLAGRNRISEEEAQKRIHSQKSLIEKYRREHNTVVVDNSQDRDAVHQEVLRLHRELTQLSSYRWMFRWILLAVVVAIGILVYRIFLIFFWI